MLCNFAIRSGLQIYKSIIICYEQATAIKSISRKPAPRVT